MPLTSEHPVPSTLWDKHSNKKNFFDGPKQAFTSENLPKVSNFSSVVEQVEHKKSLELCAKLRLLELTSKDVQCHSGNIKAKICHDNICRTEGGFFYPEGEKSEYLKNIVAGLKTPKYSPSKITLEEIRKQIELEEKEKQNPVQEEPVKLVEDENLNQGDFEVFVKDDSYPDCPILDEIIPDISHLPWYRNYKMSHMRLDRLMNQPDIKFAKVEAADLILTYKPKMARPAKNPVLRTSVEQAKRNKNTLATRVSRTRAKHVEEQVDLMGAYWDKKNTMVRRENAALVTYLQKLTDLMRAQPRNWNQITEEMIAKEFVDEKENEATNKDCAKADDDETMKEKEKLTIDDCVESAEDETMETSS